jgi:hypothetical protein
MSFSLGSFSDDADTFSLDVDESLVQANNPEEMVSDRVEFMSRPDGTVWLRVPVQKSPVQYLHLPMDELTILSIEGIGHNQSLLRVHHRSADVQEEHNVNVASEDLARSMTHLCQLAIPSPDG